LPNKLECLFLAAFTA